MKAKIHTLLFALLICCNYCFAAKPGKGDAKNEANICAAQGILSCDKNTRPCAVLNKSTTRTITVKVEETFVFGNIISKKVLTFEKVNPQENKYIGCAGCIESPQGRKCIGYKIIDAWYND